MRLPHPDNAVVDERKLRDYCLSREHPRGRHKARVFAATLGLTASDTEELRQTLLFAARTGEAVPAATDQYGQRYLPDFQMVTQAGHATIRRGWIVRTGEGFARFTSCWVLRSAR